MDLFLKKNTTQRKFFVIKRGGDDCFFFYFFWCIIVFQKKQFLRPLLHQKMSFEYYEQFNEIFCDLEVDLCSLDMKTGLFNFAKENDSAIWSYGGFGCTLPESPMSEDGEFLQLFFQILATYKNICRNVGYKDRFDKERFGALCKLKNKK